VSDPLRPARAKPPPTATDWGLRAPQRPESLPARAVYANAIARDYAERGHTKFAELVEIGHACAACHLTRERNGVPSNAQLDLDRYARVTAGMRAARTAVEIFQTAFMGALASFERKMASSAYRIRVEGYGTTARDAITLEQMGKEIASNPVARRAYAQVQKHNTEMILDFKTTATDAFGTASWYDNQIIVYVARHPNAKSAVSTLVHETSHIHRFSKGHVSNLYDEYRAHARAFLYDHGRRPNVIDRHLLWKQVRRNYPGLE
jgi:hypothetical protein